MDRTNPYESPRTLSPEEAPFPRWACLAHVLAMAVPVGVALYFHASTIPRINLLAFISFGLAAPYVCAALTAPLVMILAGRRFRDAFFASLWWTSSLFSVPMALFGVYGLLYELGLV